MTLATLIPRFDPLAPKGCIENMRDLYNELPDYDPNRVAFIHSDVTIYDTKWPSKVEDFFNEHPRCGLLGFGGATGLGSKDIYRTRYQLVQLARFNYASNQRDWQVHGERLTEPRRVAMLDGFCLIFRRVAYEDMGGWDDALNIGLTFHMYDFHACCRMAELGWEVWALPIDVMHYGGGVSVTTQYDSWLRSQGINGDSEIHTKAHQICYERWRKLLPIRIK